MGETPLLAGRRQKGETRRAVIACNDYLRMGPGRSLAKLCKLYRSQRATQPPTRRLPTLKEWSRRFGWVERAEEYDAAMESQRDEQVLRELNEMKGRQLMIAEALQTIAAMRLQRMKPEELKARDVLRYLREGMEWERKARQLPVKGVLSIGEPESPGEIMALPEGREREQEREE